MKLTQADWLRIAGIVVGIGSALNTQALEAMGIAATTASHVVAVVGFVVLAVSIISGKLANPSPPAGTNFAAIPAGSIPAVGVATGGGPSVTEVDPATSTVRSLSEAAPKGP